MPEILAVGTFVSLTVPQINPNNVLTYTAAILYLILYGCNNCGSLIFNNPSCLCLQVKVTKQWLGRNVFIFCKS